MRKFYFLVLLAMLSLSLGFAISCGDDDDDSSGDDDDDNVSGDTWTDSSSGLNWQVTPSSDNLTWDDAKSYCDNLSLDGGGWHLPTISELRTLIRGCNVNVTGGSCGVTDSCLDSDCQDESCYACNTEEGPNNGCYGPSELPSECDWYWSSSAVAAGAGYAWFVSFDDGNVFNYPIDYDFFARCVRP